MWDFEMSKIEGICLGHKQDITAIEFLEPYPLMLTASLDGYVCVWGVRPCPIQYKSICIARLRNVSWQYSEDLLTPVTKLQVLGPVEQKGMEKAKRFKMASFNASKYGNFRKNNLLMLIEKRLRMKLIEEHDKVYTQTCQPMIKNLMNGTYEHY